MEGQVNSRETPKVRIQNNPSKQQRNVPLQVVEGVSQKDWGQMVWHVAEGYVSLHGTQKTKALELRKERQTTKKFTLGSL